MAKKRRRGGVPASMRGEFPGEYKKISLVEVPLGIMTKAALDAQRDEYGDLDATALGRVPTTRYIVDTRRLDGQWSVEVEHKGERWRLPHKVIEQIRRHCDSIIKAQRSDRAREAAMERMGKGVLPFQAIDEKAG